MGGRMQCREIARQSRGTRVGAFSWEQSARAYNNGSAWRECEAELAERVEAGTN
jgi:hypothetical protein